MARTIEKQTSPRGKPREENRSRFNSFIVTRERDAARPRPCRREICKNCSSRQREAPAEPQSLERVKRMCSVWNAFGTAELRRQERYS